MNYPSQFTLLIKSKRKINRFIQFPLKQFSYVFHLTQLFCRSLVSDKGLQTLYAPSPFFAPDFIPFWLFGFCVRTEHQSLQVRFSQLLIFSKLIYLTKTYTLNLFIHDAPKWKIYKYLYKNFEELSNPALKLTFMRYFQHEMKKKKC